MNERIAKEPITNRNKAPVLALFAIRHLAIRSPKKRNGPSQAGAVRHYKACVGRSYAALKPLKVFSTCAVTGLVVSLTIFWVSSWNSRT